MMKSYSFRLPDAYYKYLKNLGGGDATKGLRILVQTNIPLQPPTQAATKVTLSDVVTRLKVTDQMLVEERRDLTRAERRLETMESYREIYEHGKEVVAHMRKGESCEEHEFNFPDAGILSPDEGPTNRVTINASVVGMGRANEEVIITEGQTGSSADDLDTWLDAKLKPKFSSIDTSIASIGITEDWIQELEHQREGLVQQYDKLTAQSQTPKPVQPVQSVQPVTEAIQTNTQATNSSVKGLETNP